MWRSDADHTHSRLEIAGEYEVPELHVQHLEDISVEVDARCDHDEGHLIYFSHLGIAMRLRL